MLLLQTYWENAQLIKGMIQSVLVTWLSRPSSSSMKKKSAAHSGATGIRLTAFGYAMKARPGPETHTNTGIRDFTGF